MEKAEKQIESLTAQVRSLEEKAATEYVMAYKVCL